MLLRILGLGLLQAVLLAGCTGGSGRAQKSLAEMGMMERRARGLKAMQSAGSGGEKLFPSQFQRSAMRAMNGANEGSVDWLQSKRSRVPSFKQAGPWNGGRSFATTEFSQAATPGTLPMKADPQAGMISGLGREQFAAGDSKFSVKGSPLAGQVSPLANDRFAAGRDVIGSKAFANAREPKVIELPEQAAKPAFTEDEVKKLLGRDAGRAP